MARLHDFAQNVSTLKLYSYLIRPKVAKPKMRNPIPTAVWRVAKRRFGPKLRSTLASTFIKVDEGCAGAWWVARKIWRPLRTPRWMLNFGVLRKFHHRLRG